MHEEREREIAEERGGRGLGNTRGQSNTKKRGERSPESFKLKQYRELYGGWSHAGMLLEAPNFFLTHLENNSTFQIWHKQPRFFFCLYRWSSLCNHPIFQTNLKHVVI